jgi:hypothetical protein
MDPRLKEDLTDLIEAVFFSSQEVLDALQAMKRGDQTADFRVRTAVAEVVGQMLDGKLGVPSAKRLKELTGEIAGLATVMRGTGEQVERVSAETVALRESVDTLNQELHALLAGSAVEVLKAFLPGESLRKRYVGDYAEEKRVIANYVARTFFDHRPARCFVQASTTAIHLADELCRRKAPEDLFHTNSVVFPMKMLGGTFRSVYALCGPLYDAFCGGWLFIDGETEGYLRSLFRRDHDPLRTSLLTPIATTAEEGTFYTRNETSRLVNILMEESQEVIIMTFAARVYASQEDFPSPYPGEFCPALDWSDLRDRAPKVPSNGRKPRISLVISNAERSDALEPLIPRLVSQGLSVHWQDAAGEWKQEA